MISIYDKLLVYGVYLAIFLLITVGVPKMMCHTSKVSEEE